MKLVFPIYLQLFSREGRLTFVEQKIRARKKVDKLRRRTFSTDEISKKFYFKLQSAVLSSENKGLAY